jgi:hypothetical protein
MSSTAINTHTTGDLIYASMLKSRGIRTDRKLTTKARNLASRSGINTRHPSVNGYVETYEAAVKTVIRSQNNQRRIQAAFDKASAGLAYAKYQERRGNHRIAKYWAKCMELINFDATPDELTSLLAYLQLVKIGTDAMPELYSKFKAASAAQSDLMWPLFGAEERLKHRQTELARVHKIGATESYSTQAIATAKSDAVYASLADASSYAETEALKSAHDRVHFENLDAEYSRRIYVGR